MSESREVLIDAMSDASGMPAQTEVFAACLDALLAHPVAVLSELENAPCPAGCTNGLVWTRFKGWTTCSACGGSGILGRDGLLRALGMEPLDKTATRIINDNEWRHYTVRHDATVWAEPVPVPEPSEGADR